MASKLSLSELTKLYSTSNKPPIPVEPSTRLQGTSTLDKLSKLLFSRESSKLFAAPSRQAAAPSSSTSSSKKGIAICLVIVDELFHELIWKQWTEQSSEKYNVKLFIHAKHPERIKSLWVQSFLLKGKTFKPEWNSPEVIRAMLAVMEEALTDEFSAGRLVFGTESCIPICNLDIAGDSLYSEDVSWLNCFDTGKTNWESAACFRSVDSSMIPPKAVWKTIPGWMMLNRRHAAEIVNLQKCIGDDLVRAWGPGGQWKDGNGVFAPEEVFFSTMLAILGYLRKGGGASTTAGAAGSNGGTSVTSSLDQVRRKMVTYATWARSGEANPVAYDRLTAVLLAECRREGCLFARKFGRHAVSLSEWSMLVEGVDGDGTSTKKRARPEEHSGAREHVGDDLEARATKQLAK